MAVTFTPVFNALGYTSGKQQRALIKLLHAAAAFGDVGVEGMLTDKQADAILQHLHFHDTEQAARLLHEITQEHFIQRRQGMERCDCVEPERFKAQRAELVAALRDLGMLEEIKPARKHYDHVLLLGATEGEVAGRFETLKRLWDEGVRFDKIHMLGSKRALRPELEPSAGRIGPNGTKITDEMGMMEAHYYDAMTRWPEGMEKVRIFEVNTYNKPGGERANTQDTVKAWQKTRPDAGSVLVVSSQPYARYQDAAVKSALPPSFQVDTVGAVASNDIKIGVAVDTLARQIDAGLPQLLEKLKTAPAAPAPQVARLDPARINVDAATYQFRAGGDANGVTRKGRHHAKRWDPLLHGDPILVHERLDGSMYVADGHHRLGLAKELNAKGAGPGEILAMVLREADGYTAKDARLVAAYKNIAQGHADAVEAARIFKEARAGDVHQELLPSLQMDKGNLRLSYSMSRLSDAALAQVADGVVTPLIAARLAEVVPDDHRRQESVMRIIAGKLRQSYPPPEAIRPTVTQVNVFSLGKPADRGMTPGFVAKLVQERAQGAVLAIG